MVSLANEPDKEENNKNARAAQTTALEAQVSVVGREKERARAHSEASEEGTGDPVAIFAKETASFQLGLQVLRCLLL